MKYFFPLLFISLLIFSCKKIKAHKYSGNYDCEVRSYSWMLGEPSTETITQGELVIERNGNKLNVLNREIEVSEIVDGEVLVVSSYPSIFEIKFTGKSIYCYSYSGGHGGGGGTTYNGQKISN